MKLKLLFFFLFFSCSLFALTIPPLQRPVQDEAGLLRPNEVQTLEQEIRALYSLKNNEGRELPQVQILIVDTLQDLTIEEFSIKVAEEWKLGNKKSGNGLLLIVSTNPRKVRIEVGDGIEDLITDYHANAWIKKIIGPAFKEGAYFDGLYSTLSAIKSIYGISDESAVGTHPRKIKKKSPFSFFTLIIFFLLIIFSRFLGGHSSSRFGGYGSGPRIGGGSGWGGGGSGWGGGGGGFSGGGASGDW